MNKEALLKQFEFGMAPPWPKVNIGKKSPLRSYLSARVRATLELFVDKNDVSAEHTRKPQRESGQRLCPMEEGCRPDCLSRDVLTSQG